MDQFLGLMTAMGAMMGSNSPIVGPIECEREISSALDPLVLQDEQGRLSDTMLVEKREAGRPQAYNYAFRVRQPDGSEHIHHYFVQASKDCQDVQVQRR